MSIVQQVLSCPLCGRSGRLERFNLDRYGNMLSQIEREVCIPIIKIQHNEGDRNIRWESHPLPLHVLQALILQVREVSEMLERMLAEMPDSE
jgi:hypothetical protein